MEIDDENFWRSQVNALPQELSSKGLDPPKEEMFENEEFNGHLAKITFDVYLFTNPLTNKHYMFQTNQKYMPMGEMTYEQAAKKIKNIMNRKKS
jgi:hypothetical protein